MTTHIYKKVVAVDLDGTYISGNSLVEYFKAGLWMLIRTRQVRRAAVFCGLALARCLRLVSHRRMKFVCLRQIGVPDEAMKTMVVRNIRRSIRPEVETYLAEARSGGAAVLLATASPAIYIPWFWPDPFVATSWPDNPGENECRGQAKLAAVREYMSRYCAAGATLTVLTDHSDDLPLMLDADKVILVKPSSSTTMAVGMAGINYTRM